MFCDPTSEQVEPDPKWDEIEFLFDAAVSVGKKTASVALERGFTSSLSIFFSAT